MNTNQAPLELCLIGYIILLTGIFIAFMSLLSQGFPTFS
jgi:hypothetical protein